MKLVEFTYKKADGSVSSRAVIEVMQPQAHFEGIDVSGMPADEFAEFTLKYRELKNQQHADMMQLINSYDLKHNYRRFNPTMMQEVTTEHI